MKQIIDWYPNKNHGGFAVVNRGEFTVVTGVPIHECLSREEVPLMVQMWAYKYMIRYSSSLETRIGN